MSKLFMLFANSRVIQMSTGEIIPIDRVTEIDGDVFTDIEDII